MPSEAYGQLIAMRGIGYDGEGIQVWHEQRLCAAGHRYQVEIFVEEWPDPAEGSTVST